MHKAEVKFGSLKRWDWGYFMIGSVDEPVSVPAVYLGELSKSVVNDEDVHGFLIGSKLLRFKTTDLFTSLVSNDHLAEFVAHSAVLEDPVYSAAYGISSPHTKAGVWRILKESDVQEGSLVVCTNEEGAPRLGVYMGATGYNKQKVKVFNEDDTIGFVEADWFDQSKAYVRRILSVASMPAE